MTGAAEAQTKTVASNRRAYHEYFIVETYEAGIALKGTEVKSIRAGQVTFQDSYASIRNGEVWLIGLYIAPFEKGNINNHDPSRDRKLLLHKREIAKLHSTSAEKGMSLIPLSVYFNKNNAKVSLGVAKGKKLYDKRETIKKRDQEREMRRDARR
jgi:SsrA-binding protein